LSKSLVHRRGTKFLWVPMARAQVCWRQSFRRGVMEYPQSARRKGITA
jgi:hypothetical protein